MDDPSAISGPSLGPGLHPGKPQGLAGGRGAIRHWGFEAAKLGILGVVSGVASWLSIDRSDANGLNFDLEAFGIVLLPIAVYPGLVFGLLFGAWFGFRRQLSWRRGLGYLAASTVAYVVAFHVAYYVVLGLFNDEQSVLGCIVGGLLAGLAGSLLLGLASRFLFRTTARAALRLPVAVGTIAGALLGLIAHDDKGWGFLAFFALWQGAYGASLASMCPGKRSPAP